MQMSSGFPLKNGICRQQLSILRAAKAFPPPLSPEVALMAIRVKLENAPRTQGAQSFRQKKVASTL